MKKLLLSFIIFSLLLAACENPLMKEILEIKKITFDTNGGSSVGSQTVIKSIKIERPKDPSKDGYTFDAWYIDNETFEHEWDFDDIPNRDMTLYAGWEIKYDLTFDVANSVQWDAAVSTINGRGAGVYLINVIADFDMDGVSANTFNALGINVTVKGNYTVSLSGTGSLLFIGANQTVTIRDLTLRGDTSNNASLVNIGGGTFNMESGIITGNINEDDDGGGVCIFGGTFNMTGGTVSNNTSANGGGVYVRGAFTMSGTAKISSNDSSYGGGVYVHPGGTFKMQDSASVSGNTADNRGGGVFVDSGGEFVMTGGTIGGTGNNAAPNGGGVYVDGGTFTMTGGTIGGVAGAGNSAQNGGGVYVTGSGGTFTMNGSGTNVPKVSGNTATNGGGLVVSGSGSTIIMNGGIVSGNEASGSGGGVCVLAFGTFQISNGIVYGSNTGNTSLNNTGSGAALFITGSGSTAQHGTFSGTGGAWVSAGNLITRNETIDVVDGVIVP